MGVLAQIDVEGALVIVAAMVLFPGSVWLLLSAVFGVRMGYLVAATGFFGFMVILSLLWSFGAPGTPPFLGPKGELPTWKPLAEGTSLTSNVPAIEQYPGDPWQEPEERQSAEVEAATLAFQDFLAEDATAELRRAGIQGEVTAETFEVSELRFATVDDTRLAAATAFAESGGPEVIVVGYKDPGNESMPSYLFLVGSVIGFAAHLPFLDRAERRRKEILTGGEQAPWRGPT
jgi:hypothetical protein